MDNDSFAGFSNSWSYGSDPRSEESISNKNRDYTSEFTTNQIFENREDMLNWTKRVGLENGIVVVIKNSAKKSVDVAPDGHCGFRAIAALIGYGEEGWMQVRAELIDEIQQNKAQYDVIFPDNSTLDNLLILLNYFETPAPERHWMESMTLGTVIASRYNIVLYIFGGTNWSCYTHLPLRSPPIIDNERMEIVIGHVGNHFVQLFLHPYHPVPPIPTWWWNHSSYEAKGWASSYQVRADLWREITSMGPPGAQFGGNID
ncbi:hypothetical protein QQ045_000559 [Rhodiola kirilowii]